MSEYKDDDKRKRIHVPRVTLDRETIRQMSERADQQGVNLSQVYQDACDFYLQARLFLQVVERFIP